ncbi:MAG: LPS export ABC transporter periplasmic protein LptC [Pseudomonadota bacterium]
MAEHRTTARAGSNRVWIMAALGLVAGGVALLVIDRDRPREVAEAPASDGAPDVHMKGADITQFRPDGTIHYELAAADIRHFQEDGRTLLTEPNMALHRTDGAPWTARARSGSLRRGAGAEELVILRDDVVLEQTGAARDSVRLDTSFLRLYPERQYAETDRDVIIAGDLGRTTASGLEGDLRAGSLELFAADGAPVHTTLTPEQFK